MDNIFSQRSIRRKLGYEINDMDIFDEYITQLITKDNMINEMYDRINELLDRVDLLEHKLNNNGA